MPGIAGGGWLQEQSGYPHASECAWDPALFGGGCQVGVWKWPALPRTGCRRAPDQPIMVSCCHDTVLSAALACSHRANTNRSPVTGLLGIVSLLQGCNCYSLLFFHSFHLQCQTESTSWTFQRLRDMITHRCGVGEGRRSRPSRATLNHATKDLDSTQYALAGSAPGHHDMLLLPPIHIPQV